MSARIRARLDALLAIEEILGAAIFDARGALEAAVNMYDHDAAALHTVLLSAMEATPATGRGPAFAAFTLSEGQMAISGDRHRTVIAITDPGLDALLLKALLADLLADMGAPPPGGDGVAASV